MTPAEAVKDVNKVWEYHADGRIDDWSFTTKGDCEDYALSVLKRIYGSEGDARRALLKREDAFIWYTTTDTGGGHAVLEYKGRFVCNRTKAWHDTKDNMRIKTWHYRYPRALLIVKLGLGRIL